MKQIYVHGLGQTPNSWEKTITQLAAVENSICPDLADMIRGTEATYRNLYEAFSDVCNKCEGPVNLCGLSLGGVLALNYAIDYPEKVNSLVLIATPYKMPKRLLRFQNMIFRFMPNSMFGPMGFGKADFLQLCKTMTELDFSESLKKISCPALIICGERDHANRSSSVKMADMMNHAELHIIRGVGHEINIEAPKKLAEVLQSFYFNQLPPAQKTTFATPG